MSDRIIAARVLLLVTLSLAGATRALAADASIDGYPCQVVASETVELASPVPGVLESLKVDRGDKVTKGQVLATLRADVERAGLALALARVAATGELSAKRAKLAYASRRLERNEKLYQTHLVSENDIDELRTDRSVAALEVQAAEEAIRVASKEADRAKAEVDIHVIYSPIDGFVTARKLSAGELVRDQSIMVIQKIDPLFVETALPVSLLGQVKVGSEGQVSFDAPNVAARAGKVTLVDPVIEPRSNTVGVRIVLDNKNAATPSGTKCSVRFGTLASH